VVGVVRVLIIEDEQNVIRDISLCLQVRYPECIIISASDGERGMEMVETESPDLVVTDSSLRDISIVDLINRIREFSDVPLVVLSEADTDMDRARGLEAGADDYVTKPFSPIELLAKIKALFRRTHGNGFTPEHAVFSCGNITINFTTREVLLSGKQVRLTPIEFRLLSELVRNEGKVLTHRRLLEKVWGTEFVDDLRFTKKYIHRLRQKLDDDPNNPRIIQTERGVGYKFVETL
jgi:two-component system KDP operon response regulator KdpE